MSSASKSSKKILIRFRLALPAARLHFFASVTVAIFVAALIFIYWFPPPFNKISGGQTIFWVLVAADTVSGPALTLLLFRPTKTKLAWTIDLTFIIILQTIAFSYGINALSQARPIAIVYEVDRFRVISYADLPPDELAHAPSWVKPLALEGPRIIGLRMAKNLDEKLASVDSSLQGVEPSQRPKFWQDYQLSVAQVLARSFPLNDLRSMHPEKKSLIDDALRATTSRNENGRTFSQEEKLRWMPIVSRHVTDWVVLIDSLSGALVGYIHLNGFVE